MRPKIRFINFQGDLDCVQALLEGSVDVNQAGNSGLTALHIAAMCGHHEVGKIYLHQG